MEWTFYLFGIWVSFGFVPFTSVQNKSLPFRPTSVGTVGERLITWVNGRNRPTAVIGVSGGFSGCHHSGSFINLLWTVVRPKFTSVIFPGKLTYEL